MPYSTNLKPSGLDVASPVTDQHVLVIEQNGVVRKISVSALEAKVFGAKTSTVTATADTDFVVIRRTPGGSLASVALNNIVPSGTITNDKISGQLQNNKLATITEAGKVSDSATSATPALSNTDAYIATGNTSGNDKIVKRNSSGNFAANVITANEFKGPVTGAVTGNASTATKWKDARNLTLTNDVTAVFTSVDGSADVSAAATLSNSGVQSGTYNNSASATNSFTVDAKGRLTAVGAAVDISIDQIKVNKSPVKQKVVVATTEPLNGSVSGDNAGISGGGSLVIDGYTVQLNDRVLVTSGVQGSSWTGPNGIYKLTVANPWTLRRDEDLNEGTDYGGAIVTVERGTINGGRTFINATVTGGIGGAWTPPNTSSRLVTVTANYTVKHSDLGAVLFVNTASNINITVPVPSMFSPGSVVTVVRYGAGDVTFVADGTNVVAAGGKLKIGQQNGVAALMVLGPNLWLLAGNLKP